MGSMNEAEGLAVAQPESAERSLSASAEVCTLRNWLGDVTLNIPNYQRPYKWSLAQVQQLLLDIEQQAQVTTQNQGAISVGLIAGSQIDF